MSGLLQIIIGCIAMGISALIVLLMSHLPNAIVFYGAFIFGIYMVIKGVINMIRGN